jgi:hypothetical protein
VRSDRNALCYLMSSKLLSSQCARYIDEIADCDITVEWKPGCEQRIVDFLSRRPCDNTSLCKQCRPRQDDKSAQCVYVCSAAGPGSRCIGQSVTEPVVVNAMHVTAPKQGLLDKSIGQETRIAADQLEATQIYSKLLTFGT